MILKMAEQDFHSTSPPGNRATVVLAGRHLLFALLFMIAAMGVLAQRYLRPEGLARWAGAAIGTVIAVFAAGTIMQRFVARDLHTDTFFLASRLGPWNLVGTPPGRIAAPTASAFILIGVGIAFLRTRRRHIVD